MAVPDAPKDDDLVLVAAGQKIQAGDSERHVLDAIPRPKGAYPTREDVSFISDEIKARGWESTQMGLLVCSKSETTVLALVRYENVTQEERLSIFNDLTKQNGAPTETVTSQYGDCAFWEKNNIRLMAINALDNQRRMSLTLAIGVPSLMDDLRMNRRLVDKDFSEAARIFGQMSSK